jgi:hypothetical protein
LLAGYTARNNFIWATAVISDHMYDIKIGLFPDFNAYILENNFRHDFGANNYAVRSGNAECPLLINYED